MSEYAIGIDLGGTSLRLASMGALHDLRLRIAMPTRVSDGPEAVVADMVQGVRELMRQQPESARLCGIGLGSPGPINLKTGELGQLPNFPGWDGFPLRNALSTALGLPVILENDANAATFAEWKLGTASRHPLPTLSSRWP